MVTHCRWRDRARAGCHAHVARGSQATVLISVIGGTELQMKSFKSVSLLAIAALALCGSPAGAPPQK
jgi:hypothetical protein